MKLTMTTLKRMIRETFRDVFNDQTGDIDEKMLDDVLQAARDGYPPAQEQLWQLAPAVKNRGGLKFSTADGTPMERDSIAKKYGLDPKSGKKIKAKEKQLASEPSSTTRQSKKQPSRNQKMIQMIQMKIDSLDPTEDSEKIKKLQRKMDLFK